ncbi:MAG: 3-hydroxyacyl-CoA dehydrogenase/enoyl-CoA hydratase family protein [Bacteroidetes bacterium]|nr:3-hydroxyacyl-CoA dehydrogenase/enoyl-CoA hydratase family protein [Bacteroidota bacterium]
MNMKKVNKVGVIGAGKMGAALAQKFAQEDFKVILADREMKFVENGLNGIRITLQEGVEKKVFTPEQTEKTIANITGSADMNDLKSCDLVLEAIFEEFNAKAELFIKLSRILEQDTIVATNTSSFSVDELSRFVKYPERFIGLHYFYHAAKNRLVEIIPGKYTSASTLDAVKLFSIRSGKDPIYCADSYGFVVNRFFVPWLNEAVKIYDEGVADIPTIDDVCRKVFGIGMGPFALMNATGVLVACHAEKTLEVFGELYKVSKRLSTQAGSGSNWNLNGEVSTNEQTRKAVANRLMGLIFYVCAQLLDEKVCSAADINRGARIGLRWEKGPIELMKQVGEEQVKQLVSGIISRYHSAMPHSIGEKFWTMNFVELEKNGSVAVITMNRPEDLNALNEEVIHQLDEKFSDASHDRAIRTIYLTGSGKTFVAGADIKFFVNKIKGDRICDIESFTGYGQEVFRKIDESPKKVVAVLNGMALGGGLELALCADVILSLPKVRMAFPETGIGIYPGLGGTFRSSRRIGVPLSKYLIHTGVMLNANDACEIGLVDKLITVDEMTAMFNDQLDIHLTPKNELTEKWRNLSFFFEKYSLEEILENKFTDNGIRKEDAEKICKTIKRKAPIALRIADHLIEGVSEDENDNELGHIREVFSTTDAMLGLSSIGKQIEYTGH